MSFRCNEIKKSYRAFKIDIGCNFQLILAYMSQIYPDMWNDVVLTGTGPN
jgi:hypothetical protein